MSKKIDEILDDDVWDVIKALFEEKNLASHQIDSYNQFINESIPNIFESSKISFVGGNLVEFGEHIIEKPIISETNGENHPLYPMEASYRSATLESPLYVDIIHSVNGKMKKIYKKILFGYIPVMTMSCLCNTTDLTDEEKYKVRECLYSKGGYFVINGGNKIVVFQERSTFNQINVFKNRKKIPKYDTYSEIRSLDSIHSTNTIVGTFDNKPYIYVTLPFIAEENPIPLIIVFRALGIIEEEDIKMLLVNGSDIEDSPELESIYESLIHSFEYAYECRNQDFALEYIGKKGKKYSDEFDDENKEITEDDKDLIRLQSISYARHLLEFEFLPHVGKRFEDKAFFLGLMVKKALYKKITDRDHFGNKSGTAVGPLLASQFSASVRKILKNIQTEGEKNKNSNINILHWVKDVIITKNMKNCILSNQWITKSSKNNGNNGISQTYERYNWSSVFANIRKIVAPVKAEGGRILLPRNLHGSHWMAVCSKDTPESKKVGLLKNLSVAYHSTSNSDSNVLLDLVDSYPGILYVNQIISKEKYKDIFSTIISINGVMNRLVKNAEKFYNYFRQLRRDGGLNFDISIFWNKQENVIEFDTKENRSARFCFIVKNKKLIFNRKHLEKIKTREWGHSDLVVRGIIELIDKREEDNCIIALYPSDLNDGTDYTHCEYHPSLCNSVSAILTPFDNSNTATKNSFQCAMGKHAIGIFASNYTSIINGTFSIPIYTQRPISQNRLAHILEAYKLSSGMNIKVAVYPMHGMNQEDSVCFNQRSVDNGLFSVLKFDSYYGEEKENQFSKIFFTIPTKDNCEKFSGNSSKLDENGIIKLGSLVEDGDILIGMISEKVVENKEKKRVNCSIVHKGDPVRISCRQMGKTVQGYTYCYIQTVELRKPENGDKFSSKHAQKGVCGFIYPYVDFPFDPFTGETYDMCINPCAFPSRKTVGQSKEGNYNRIILADSKLNKNRTKGYVCNYVKNTGFFDKPTIDATSHIKKDFTQSSYYNSLSEEDKEKCVDPWMEEDFMNLGLTKTGEKMLTDGVTGEMNKFPTFCGVNFYERLKHIAKDKIHSRARGAKTAISKQPCEGKNLDGGYKIGYQEKTSIGGQGASGVLHDRLLDQSDAYFMWMCDICGLEIIKKKGEKNLGFCNVCGSNKVSRRKLPYGAKLLSHELMSMNIVPRSITEDFKEFSITV